MKPKCDIVLLSYESPDLLKKCVKSIFEHTKISSRLIIVDNNSRDREVREYLNGLSGTATIELEKIFSERNEGFSRGINKGMRISDAPYVCILNNDCIVTEGWLEEMIMIAGADKRIGLVNPQSNTFGSYPDHSVSVNEHRVLLSYKKGMVVELGHAIGFACLIKREVIDKIGYLDEVYEGVCYEDTDYSVRAMKAGYTAVMAEGAYVYHAEQASRRTLKNKEEIYARNKLLFENKWGRLLRVLIYDPFVDNETKVFEIYDRLKSLARERAIIDLYVRENSQIEEGIHILTADNIIRHADIGLKLMNRVFVNLNIIWKVLTKKKKYDAIITRKGITYFLLKFLQFVHRGEILILDKGLVKACDGSIFQLKEAGILAKYLRK